MDNPIFQITSEIELIESRIRTHFFSDFSYINEITGHIIQGGGKRIRPLLTYLCLRLCGCRDESAIDLCVIPEYLHAASLLHDDVIDEGEIRRGKPSAYKIWGNKKTILAGDFLYARAIELATRFNNLNIASEIAKTVLLMSEGELIQLNHKNSFDYSSDIYYEIIFRKTATLIVASCKIGAYYATDDKEKLNAIGEYGKNIGLAYQITDDLMDYLPDKYDIGKIKGNDIRDGKITLPLILLMERADSNERNRMMDIILGKADGDDLSWIFNLMDNKGVTGEIRETAREYVQRACQALDIFSHSKEKEILTNIARFIVERNF